MRPGARQAPCDFPLASYYATTVQTSAWAQPNAVLAANCRKHRLSRPPKSTLPRPTSPCTAKVLETCLCPPLCRWGHGGGRVLWSPRRSCCLGEGLRRGGSMTKLISNRQEYPEKMKFHDSLRFHHDYLGLKINYRHHVLDSRAFLGKFVQILVYKLVQTIAHACYPVLLSNL
jgi:hypothetical protein